MLHGWTNHGNLACTIQYWNEVAITLEHPKCGHRLLGDIQPPKKRWGGDRYASSKWYDALCETTKFIERLMCIAGSTNRT